MFLNLIFLILNYLNHSQVFLCRNMLPILLMYVFLFCIFLGTEKSIPTAHLKCYLTVYRLLSFFEHIRINYKKYFRILTDLLHPTIFMLLILFSGFFL